MIPGLAVVKQINQQEGDIKKCYFRIETIEKALRLRELTAEQRTNYDHELTALKDLLKLNENRLKQLQRENFKTGLFASSIIFICFVFYGLHAMFWK